MRFLIITGLSGSGKSNVVKSLEDMGYFCIDNLPPSFIEKTAELFLHSRDITKIALVVDIRSRDMFADIDAGLTKLTSLNIEHEVLFLDAADDTLVKRYKETRRRHPLSPDGNLWEAIGEERHLLHTLRERANHILDTSAMSARELKAYIESHFATEDTRVGMNITVTSFGFKYGLPPESDMVLDVRFLPNPFYIKEMRSKTGLDECVRNYVMGYEQTREFVSKTRALLLFLMPFFIEEGKTHFSLSIGCTGGKHRSVALAEQAATFLTEGGFECKAVHRDIERDRVDYL